MPVVVMITNTIVPYCYDIGHVLGLPKGFSHRFRYRERWMKLAGDIRDIRGKDGIVTLRRQETGVLIPVRRVRFQDVVSIGDIHYIEFEVGDYLDERTRDEAARKMGQKIGEKGFENARGADLECLVFEIDGLSEEKTAVLEAETYVRWMAILREIGRFDCYKDFGFLRVLGVRDSEGVPAAAGRDETGKCSYRLKPGGLYFLDVVQHIPWEIEKTEAIGEPYEAELKAETGEIVILRGLQRVVGKYDLLRFIFKTASGETRRQTFIEIESKQGGEAGKYGLRRLFLPVRIELARWKKWFRVVRIFVAIAAIFAAIGADLLVRLVKTWAGVGADAELVRASALVVLVLVSGKFDEMVKEFVKEAKTVKLK